MSYQIIESRELVDDARCLNESATPVRLEIA